MRNRWLGVVSGGYGTSAQTEISRIPCRLVLIELSLVLDCPGLNVISPIAKLAQSSHQACCKLLYRSSEPRRIRQEANPLVCAPYSRAKSVFVKQRSQRPRREAKNVVRREGRRQIDDPVPPAQLLINVAEQKVEPRLIRDIDIHNTTRL